MINDALESRAEVLKLARLLEVDPARLAPFEQVAPDALRRLRDQVSDCLFESGKRGLERAATLGGLLPGAIVAQLAQRSLGPQLGGRAAALLDPDRAVDLTRRVSVDFLADIALVIDPRRLSATLAQLPPDRIVEVAAELQRRREWVAMGAVVGYLSPETLAAGLNVLDDEALLRTGFVLEDRARLDEVVARLDDERLRSIFATAAEQGLWTEVIDLALGATKQRPRFGAVLTEASDEQLDSLIAAVKADPALREASGQLGRALPKRDRARLRERLASRPGGKRVAAGLD